MGSVASAASFCGIGAVPNVIDAFTCSGADVVTWFECAPAADASNDDAVLDDAATFPNVN